MSDQLQLTVKDELWIRKIDQAFEAKMDEKRLLSEKSTLLGEAAQRWCTEARSYAQLAATWEQKAGDLERAARRNRQAFIRSTILAAIGWFGFIAMAVFAVLSYGH